MDIWSTMRAELYPPSETSSHPDRYEVTLDVPGYAPDQVTVETDSGILSILAESEERGTFSRKYRLPREVDTEAVGAELEYGVLTVTVPKAEAAQARKVPIQYGMSSSGSVGSSAT